MKRTFANKIGRYSMMSFPRRRTLRTDGLFNLLNIEPAGDVESLRGEHVHIEPMDLPANKEVVLKNVHGNAMELIAIALQSDLTRVMTFRHPIIPLLQQLNSPITSHIMSHHSTSENSVANQISSQRDKMNSELFAHLLDRFKETRFVDGSSILDQTTIDELVVRVNTGILEKIF